MHSFWLFCGNEKRKHTISIFLFCRSSLFCRVLRDETQLTSFSTFMDGIARQRDLEECTVKKRLKPKVHLQNVFILKQTNCGKAYKAKKRKNTEEFRRSKKIGRLGRSYGRGASCIDPTKYMNLCQKDTRYQAHFIFLQFRFELTTGSESGVIYKARYCIRDDKKMVFMTLIFLQIYVLPWRDIQLYECLLQSRLLKICL